MDKEIILYKDLNEKTPFFDWFNSLHDKVTRHRIQARLARIKHGNYGDHKRFLGIIEVRMDFGKGYRLYCTEDGAVLVILLAGGDKSSQDKDIKEALRYRRDYYEQK